MTFYLVVKWIHVLSSVVLVGTGFGSAFYFYFANRSRDIAAQAVVSRLVVRADWWLTLPTVLLQPATGLMLAEFNGWPLSTPWLAASAMLYLVAGTCWIPVVWLQIRMAKMARDAQHTQADLPPIYWRYERWWQCLGYPAFAAMLVILYLMIAKPALAI